MSRNKRGGFTEVDPKLLKRLIVATGKFIPDPVPPVIGADAVKRRKFLVGLQKATRDFVPSLPNETRPDETPRRHKDDDGGAFVIMMVIMILTTFAALSQIQMDMQKDTALLRQTVENQTILLRQIRDESVMMHSILERIARQSAWGNFW